MFLSQTDSQQLFSNQATSPNDHPQSGASYVSDVERHLQEPRTNVAERDAQEPEANTQAAKEEGLPQNGGEVLPNEEQGDIDENDFSPVHSIFSRRKRIFIVTMAGLGAFFSPLSANIYFPALNPLATELGVSQGLINLTLTSYMIFQGLAPTFMGNLADTAGRRPAYIIGFIIYIGACIGLALQDNYAALIILRCMQSSGSSSTIALSSGVSSDVASAAERGTWMGWVNGGALIGPAVGPIIGGIISEYAGWRWIFWFLAIFAGVYFIFLVIAFPETGRKVVGDGSIPPQSWNRTPWDVLQSARYRKHQNVLERTASHRSTRSVRSAMAAKRKLRMPNPFKTFRLVFEKDVGMLLLYNSLVYTAFYDVAASVPYMFGETYGFNDLKIGLVFIPFGVGNFLAPLINGRRIMDWNFRRVARKIGVPIKKGRTMDTRHFPLERVRIPLALVLVLVGNVTLLVYGWVMDMKHPPLAVPLVLLFMMGYCLTGGFNVMSVMLVDYYPMNSASATACNNLCRCLLGAGGTGVVTYMIDAMGRGWCFTFVALVVFMTSPILWVLMRWGPNWREERLARNESVMTQHP